jgi:hypothetical protein
VPDKELPLAFLILLLLFLFILLVSVSVVGGGRGTSALLLSAAVLAASTRVPRLGGSWSRGGIGDG